GGTDMQMQGRAALITGASRGLGLEIARAYAARGAKLVIAARGQKALDAAEAELRTLTDVVALALDVSEDAARLVEAGTQAFGRAGRRALAPGGRGGRRARLRGSGGGRDSPGRRHQGARSRRLRERRVVATAPRLHTLDFVLPKVLGARVPIGGAHV